MQCEQPDCPPLVAKEPEYESDPIQEIDFEEELTVVAEDAELEERAEQAQTAEQTPPEVRRTITLPSGRAIELNQQQIEALALMEEWTKDREDLFFRLSGYAGTGKTTIVKEEIKYFGARHPYGMSSVGVSAPTHKAKKVIADATKLDAATLQSLLGLAPNTDLADFDINKPEFAASKKPTIENFRMIVLDEGSMVNKELWDMLKTNARRFNVKLLVMLDEAQLPPVKENLSTIITDPDIKYFYQLTKVERQAGDNPLMLIYDAIRNNLKVEHDQFQHSDDVRTILRPDHAGPEDPRSVDIQIGHLFYHDIMVFGRAVINEYRGEEFHYDKNHVKVLCWTNARVGFWNQSIRKTLMSDLVARPNISEEVKLHAGVLMPDELLMAVSNSGDLVNSSEYQIISMQYDNKRLWYGEKKELVATVAGYRVSLMDVDQNTIMNTFILDPEEENVKTFTKVFNMYLFLAKSKRQWSAYYAFKGETMLIRDIKDVRGSLVCKKDLDYAYALSVHKSQGSTFNQVFIDLEDINKNKNWVERNKLKYVAFSRPRYLATVLTGGK